MSRTYRLRHWKCGPVAVKKYVDSGLRVRTRQKERKVDGYPWTSYLGSKYEPTLSTANIGFSGLAGWGCLANVPSSIKKPNRIRIHRWLRHREREILKKADSDWDSFAWESRELWLFRDAWDLTI